MTITLDRLINWQTAAEIAFQKMGIDIEKYSAEERGSIIYLSAELNAIVSIISKTIEIECNIE